MELKTTNRGFDRIEFEDYNNEVCSLQKSSIATEDCIWLGVDNANPQVLSSTTSSTKQTGWEPVAFPDETLFTTRMHLTQAQVAALLPFLHDFVKTGELP